MEDKANKEAERLIELYRMHDIMITDLTGEELIGYEQKHYLRCALIDVENTIKVLEQLSIDDSGSVFRDFGHVFYYEVKQILEDKLK